MNIELDAKLSLLEAQLEGLFRQLYQACTQSALKFKLLSKYSLMIQEINKLTSEMMEIMKEGNTDLQ